MKKKNIARRALEKMGIGKRSKKNEAASSPMMQSTEPQLAPGAVYQAPHATTNLDRKLKRRHVSNFARQCAEYIQQVLAKRKQARAARQLGGSH
jgi:hypothetical protein